jgi:hypothetical protein
VNKMQVAPPTPESEKMSRLLADMSASVSSSINTQVEEFLNLHLDKIGTHKLVQYKEVSKRDKNDPNVMFFTRLCCLVPIDVTQPLSETEANRQYPHIVTIWALRLAPKEGRK